VKESGGNKTKRKSGKIAEGKEIYQIQNCFRKRKNETEDKGKIPGIFFGCIFNDKEFKDFLDNIGIR
jgi:hypothetical protein